MYFGGATLRSSSAAIGAVLWHICGHYAVDELGLQHVRTFLERCTAKHVCRISVGP